MNAKSVNAFFTTYLFCNGLSFCSFFGLLINLWWVRAISVDGNKKKLYHNCIYIVFDFFLNIRCGVCLDVYGLNCAVGVLECQIFPILTIEVIYSWLKVWDKVIFNGIELVFDYPAFLKKMPAFSLRVADRTIPWYHVDVQRLSVIYLKLFTLLSLHEHKQRYFEIFWRKMNKIYCWQRCNICLNENLTVQFLYFKYQANGSIAKSDFANKSA